MNKERLREWVKALRSGEYKQGKGVIWWMYQLGEMNDNARRV